MISFIELSFFTADILQSDLDLDDGEFERLSLGIEACFNGGNLA